MPERTTPFLGFLLGELVLSGFYMKQAAHYILFENADDASCCVIAKGCPGLAIFVAMH